MARTFKQFFRYVPKAEARAVLISLCVGVAMLCIKALAYARTGSASILSDALEGVVNIFAAAFAAFSLSTAHRPADPEHPYGHGKIEFLSAAFEGGMIVLAALVIVGEGTMDIWRIHHGRATVERIEYGLLLIAATMVVHGFLGGYLINAGKRVGSITLEADGWHLISDAVTSATVITALLIVRFTGWAYADPLGAYAVAVYVMMTGYALIRRSAAGLMDEQDVADDKLFNEILTAHVGAEGKEPVICSYHKLRHRHSGRYHWVDFHLVVPGHWNVREGHDVASSIEYEIEQALVTGNATAHIEPCQGETCGRCGRAHRV